MLEIVLTSFPSFSLFFFLLFPPLFLLFLPIFLPRLNTGQKGTLPAPLHPSRNTRAQNLAQCKDSPRVPLHWHRNLVYKNPRRLSQTLSSPLGCRPPPFSSLFPLLYTLLLVLFYSTFVTTRSRIQTNGLSHLFKVVNQVKDL